MSEQTKLQGLSCKKQRTTSSYRQYARFDGRVGRLSIDGLPKGAGAPIGNALRKTLLSQLEGVAVTAVRIAGARHEFDCVDGVAEDITEVIANLRQLELKVRENKNEPMSLRICTNQREVKALDIETNGAVEILNPQLHIATLNPATHLEMEIEIENGTGFCLAKGNRKQSHSSDTIPVTSDFSPVKRVGYTTENNDGQSDSLNLEIVTNGTVTPVDAASQAVKILMDCLEDGVSHSEFNGKTGRFGLTEPAMRLLGSALRWELLSYKTESNDRPVLDVQVREAIPRIGVQPSTSAVEIRTDGTLSPKAAFDAAQKQLIEKLANLQAATLSLDPVPTGSMSYLVFLMYSFLIRHRPRRNGIQRQCGSFRKWCKHVRQTFGDLLDTIRTKLMLHFQRWCSENQTKWHEFLQQQKGISIEGYALS